MPGDQACVGGVRIDVIDTVSHLRPSAASNAPGGSQGRPDFRSTSLASVADAVLEAPDPLRDEHRQGTITIVFSDIEGSTQSLSRSGDRRWFEMLQAHNEIVVDSVARSGGSIVKSQGDGFMMTFPSARRAVQAALDVNERLEDGSATLGSIRVRIGLHTGEGDRRRRR